MRRRREQQRVGDRHQWCALPARCDIAHAEIGNDIQSRSLGDHGRVADLPCGERRFMPDGVTVRRDRGNISTCYATFGDHSYGGIGEPGTEFEVETRVFARRGAGERSCETIALGGAVCSLNEGK